MEKERPRGTRKVVNMSRNYKRRERKGRVGGRHGGCAFGWMDHMK